MIRLPQNVRNTAAFLTVSAMSMASAFAQAADPEAGMAQAQTTILALIAAAGAAMIAVALAGVGWNVGAKLIKRIGGKA